ncbi:MAG: thermonuclease family protein [Armatimonadetes bacterium]|nr:thermonuclease family protein [Armatimonadota bacterium]
MKRESKFVRKPLGNFSPFRLPFVAAIFLVLFAFASQRQLIRQPKEARSGLKVIKVIDGDTVVLSDGRTVRYIGIDTPEFGQPFYEAAKNFNRNLVENKLVDLEFDVERYDHYGRLLAYVFVRDKSGRRIFVNGEMIRNGFARTYTKPPNVKYSDLFVKLQREAMASHRGLWSVYKPTRLAVVGNKRTKVFHRPNCSLVRKISHQNLVYFQNAEKALAEGFQPCRVCQP